MAEVSTSHPLPPTVAFVEHPQLYRVTPDDASVLWADISPFIQNVIGTMNGEMELDDVAEKVFDGKWQLWAMFGPTGCLHGILVTQIVSYPRALATEVIMFSADASREDWLPLFIDNSALEQWARLMGCSMIIADARPGFERVLKDMGYTRWYVRIGKRLESPTF